MPKIEKIFYRKGEHNRDFKLIVNRIVRCLESIGNDSNLDSKLLELLTETDSSYLKNNEIPIFSRSGHKVDIYSKKKKIAIEIEKTEVKYIWKIFCKFSIGARKGFINYAVLVVPMKYRGRGEMKRSSNIFKESVKASKFMADRYIVEQELGHNRL